MLSKIYARVAKMQHKMLEFSKFTEEPNKKLMELNDVFSQLWHEYTTQNPAVGDIYNLFKQREGTDVNHDHVAFRTFNDPRVGLDRIVALFRPFGYEIKQEYDFEKKRLDAKHLECENHNAPKIFVSELRLQDFSSFLQDTIGQWLENVPDDAGQDVSFLWSSNPWNKPSYQTYLKLRDESEYAAWMYVYGFRINHFAIFVNHLKVYNDIRSINEMIKANGYTLNQSGGEIKGSREKLLEQSSIMAEKANVEFQEGVYRIPACYYEFTQRYPNPQGDLYHGFYASSADKIFESTHYY